MGSEWRQRLGEVHLPVLSTPLFGLSGAGVTVGATAKTGSQGDCDAPSQVARLRSPQLATMHVAGAMEGSDRVKTADRYVSDAVQTSRGGGPDE